MTKQETIKVCLVDEKPVFWPDVGKLKVRSGTVTMNDFTPIGCTVTTQRGGGYTDSYYVYYSELHPTEYDAMIAMADKIDALVVLREKRLAKLRKKAVEFRAPRLHRWRFETTGGSMSSTNRGATRQPNDFYPTPAWCVKALLATVKLPKGCWLEPAVGDGAIIKAVNEIRRNEIDWFANDVETRWLNDPNVQYYNYRYDAEGLGGGGLFDVVITNPPYDQAMEFVKGAMVDGKIVVMLLRLAFLETKARNKFLQEHPPSVYVLPKRPTFGPNAKHVREGKLDAKDTDSCAYAWFVWGMDSTPKIAVIDWNLCKA